MSVAHSAYPLLSNPPQPESWTRDVNRGLIPLMSLAIPPGDDRLPQGRHPATVAEIEATFVNGFATSVSRRPLFDRWRLVCHAIERIISIQEQWLNGSYVTTKENPRDIDIASHLDGPTLDRLDPVEATLLVGLVHGHESRDIHYCDSFVIAAYPTGHAERPKYEAAMQYWEYVFGHHRDGNPKGYVEVTDPNA